MDEQNILLPDIKRELIIAVTIAIIVVVFAAVYGLDALDRHIQNSYFILRGPIPRPIARETGEATAVTVIEIDGKTEDALAKRWGNFPYPRDVYLELLAKLSTGKNGKPKRIPRVVAFDLQLGERKTGGGQTDPKIDTKLAALFPRLQVFLPTSYRYSVQEEDDVGPPELWTFDGLSITARPVKKLPSTGIRWENPASVFTKSAEGGGIRCLVREQDGACRRLPLGIRYREKTYPEFSYALVNYTEKMATDPALQPDSVKIPIDRDQLIPINFAGPVRNPGGETAFDVYSLSDVLSMTPEQIEQHFTEAYVLIGVALPGVVEFTPTPYDPEVHFPVETLAHAVRMHLEENYLTVIDAKYGVPLAFLVVVLIGLFLPSLSAYKGLGMTLAMTAALYSLGLYTFTVHKLVLPVTLPLLIPLATYPVVMIARLAREERRRRSLQRHFTQYLSTDIVMQLMDQPGFISMEGELREVTLMFADLRNFTAWAATQTPLDVITQLNEFFSEMSRVIEDHGGSVDKYIGDEIMAIFGAPVALENPERNAISTALEMQERLESLNRQWEMEDRHVFQMGIAIHTGDAVVGEVGAETRRNYTAIGTTVNITARLEEKTKEFGLKILATRATIEKVSEFFEYREIGPVMLRGITQPVIVYEIVDRKGSYRPAHLRDGADRGASPAGNPQERT